MGCLPSCFAGSWLRVLRHRVVVERQRVAVGLIDELPSAHSENLPVGAHIHVWAATEAGRGRPRSWIHDGGAFDQGTGCALLDG
jgi:hypothetical protein